MKNPQLRKEKTTNKIHKAKDMINYKNKTKNMLQQTVNVIHKYTKIQNHSFHSLNFQLQLTKIIIMILLINNIINNNNNATNKKMTLKIRTKIT